MRSSRDGAALLDFFSLLNMMLRYEVTGWKDEEQLHLGTCAAYEHWTCTYLNWSAHTCHTSPSPPEVCSMITLHSDLILCYGDIISSAVVIQMSKVLLTSQLASPGSMGG